MSEFIINKNKDFNSKEEDILNNPIIEYSYPICIFKNIKKEKEEIRKIQYKIICSKKEKELKEKKLFNLKRNLSSKIISFNNKNKLRNINYNINDNKKKLIRANSNPTYPYSKQEDYIFKKNCLSQIEKRGNYYNKKKISYLQRRALNIFSLSSYPRMDLNNSNLILDNRNHQSKLIETENKFDSEIRQFSNNRIIAINEKKSNIDEYFNINNKQILPKINREEFKFHVFHDKNGLKKELTKPPTRILKMTKAKIRDLKVMASINKIRDPDIIRKYKSLIH